jgi:hypothetical protein
MAGPKDKACATGSALSLAGQWAMANAPSAWQSGLNTWGKYGFSPADVARLACCLQPNDGPDAILMLVLGGEHPPFTGISPADLVEFLLMIRGESEYRKCRALAYGQKARVKARALRQAPKSIGASAFALPSRKRRF